MSKAWMPMYWGDYLADTGHLTQAQHGAYILLIAHYWKKGGLPDKMQCICIARAMHEQEKCNVEFVLNEFFIKDENGYKHKRLDAELSKAEENHKKRADAADKRWKKDAKQEPDPMQSICNADAKHNPMHVLPQSQSQIKEKGSLPESELPGDTPPSGKSKNKRRQPEIDFDAALLHAWEQIPGRLNVHVKAFIANAASENKTGTIAQSRELSLLGELSGVLAACGDEERFMAALIAANGKGVPNVNYVKSVIQTQLKKGNGNVNGKNGTSPPNGIEAKLAGLKEDLKNAHKLLVMAEQGDDERRKSELRGRVDFFEAQIKKLEGQAA